MSWTAVLSLPSAVSSRYVTERIAGSAMKDSLKTAQIELRLDPELKEAAEKAAAAEQLSLASFLENLLVDYCRERGLYPKIGG
jgi:predicted HicB family RNase H-like nuclease